MIQKYLFDMKYIYLIVNCLHAWLEIYLYKQPQKMVLLNQHDSGDSNPKALKEFVHKYTFKDLTQSSSQEQH